MKFGDFGETSKPRFGLGFAPFWKRIGVKMTVLSCFLGSAQLERSSFGWFGDFDKTSKPRFGLGFALSGNGLGKK